jgi:Zn-dependent M28 family amino/carboxypeptidase
VAVALELARLLVADSLIRLHAPVVFLLNGGEEAFLLGSHAFAARSRFAKGLGAFLNMCAGGPSLRSTKFVGCWRGPSQVLPDSMLLPASV